MLQQTHPLRAVLRCYTSYWLTWVMLIGFPLVSALIAWDWTIYWNATNFTEVRADRWHSNHLYVREPLTGDALIELLGHRRFQALEIMHLQKMTPAAWNALAQQPLKTLKIWSLDAPRWENVRLPPTIEQLDVSFSGIDLQPGTDQTCLQMFQGLQQLKAARIPLYSAPTVGLTPKEQMILRELPALMRIYVDPPFAETVQRQLPEIAVRPTSYQASRTGKAGLLMLVGLVFLLYQLHVLSLQFAGPISRLTPRFQNCHLSVAGGLFLAFWCVELASFLWSRFALGPALAMAGVVLIPAYLMTAMIDRFGRFPGYINAFVSVGLAVFAYALSQGLIMANRPETDWMFQGHRPDVVILLLVLEAVSLVGFYRFFAILSRKLTEQAAGAVPFEVWNPKSQQEWVLQNQQRQSETWLQRWLMSGQRRRLDLLLHTPRTSPAYQSRLWRAGIVQTPTEMFVRVAVMMGLMFIAFKAAGSLMGMPDIPFFQSFGMQVLIMSLFGPAMSLQLWLPNLVRHLLMTVPRTDWVQLIFREMAKDFLPTIGVGLLGLIYYYMTAKPEMWPWWHVMLAGGAAIGIVYASMLLIFTYPMWISLPLFIGFCALPAAFFGIIAIVVGPDGPGAEVEAWLLWPPLWWGPAYFMAVILIVWAHRRWMAWELGLIRT